MKATHSLSSIYSSFASAETLFATQANWADRQRLISRGHFCLHSPMFHHVSLCFTMFYPCFTMFHPCFTMFHPWSTMFHPFFTHVLPCFIYASPMFHVSSMFHHVLSMFHLCFTHVSPCSIHVSLCFTHVSSMFHHVPSRFHCVSPMFHPCFIHVSPMFHHVSPQMSKFIFPIGFSNHSSVFGGCSRTWTARWGKCTLLSRNKIGFSVWDSLGWFPFQSPKPHSWPQYSWAARRPASCLVCLQCPLLGVLLLQKAEHMCIPQSLALQRSTNSCLRLW